MKKKTYNLDYEQFKADMLVTLANNRLLELEFVNQEMIKMIFEDKLPYNKVIENLRDKIYNRIGDYKKVLVRNKGEVLNVE